MYVIGLTGGVGSGKTVAAGRLADIADAELLIADDLGHLVMEKGKRGYQEIVGTFGSNILDGQGEIDRRKLSELVFGDSEQLEKLKALQECENPRPRNREERRKQEKRNKRKRKAR